MSALSDVLQATACQSIRERPLCFCLKRERCARSASSHQLCLSFASNDRGVTRSRHNFPEALCVQMYVRACPISFRFVGLLGVQVHHHTPNHYTIIPHHLCTSVRVQLKSNSLKIHCVICGSFVWLAAPLLPILSLSDHLFRVAISLIVVDMVLAEGCARAAHSKHNGRNA